MKSGISIYKTFYLLLILSMVVRSEATCQQVPGKDENIPFLVTFGKEGKVSWGDDSFYSVWFFLIPKDYSKPFYIKVFDPDCGGENDEIQGDFNTRTMFSIYGGTGVDPDKNEESRGVEKTSNYKKGNLLASRAFARDPKTDNKYYVFGPFNPTDGDFNLKWNRYIFKIVCEGISGDDGNLYRYYLTSDPDPNSSSPIEGANAFTYKYIFRMWNDFKSVAHIYPYIDTGIVSVQQENFDWDNDGKILVVSRYKQGIEQTISNEADWQTSKIGVEEREWNSSLDFQFHKKQGELVKNNNVVILTKNQYGESMPYFSSPIGGVPVYIPSLQKTKLPPKK